MFYDYENEAFNYYSDSKTHTFKALETVARKYVGPKGKIVGVDLLDMDPIDGIDFIKGDFRDQKIVEQIQERTEIQGLDLVISDMAPTFSGVREIDQPNSIH